MSINFIIIIYYDDDNPDEERLLTQSPGKHRHQQPANIWVRPSPQLRKSHRPARTGDTSGS